jgi:membrane-bound acyltransferase YfiQ involved in biofilm formation
MDSFLQRAVSAMSFGIYLFGIALLIAGLVYAAAMLHAPGHWIVVGTLMLLGAGIVGAVKATRQRDPAE